MIIEMVGINCSSAELDVRQLFSPSKERLKLILEDVKHLHNVSGCVVISTCNRTEMYLSLYEEVDVLELFCEQFEQTSDKYRQYITMKKGTDAVEHLMLLSSGLLSQIRGDDQILSQVKDALSLSRESKATDSALEVVFRNAVSCGKQVKTDINILSVNTSVSSHALKRVKQHFGIVKNKKILVIGNGRIGRHTAELFVDEGADVFITLRNYKSGVSIVPDGVAAVEYENRYSVIDGCDVLISATASPHYTVTKQALEHVSVLPELALDLAVPRDIETSVEGLGVELWDIDSFGSEATDLEECYKAKVEDIMKKHKKRLYNWFEYSNKISLSKEK